MSPAGIMVVMLPCVRYGLVNCVLLLGIDCTRCVIVSAKNDLILATFAIHSTDANELSVEYLGNEIKANLLTVLQQSCTTLRFAGHNGETKFVNSKHSLSGSLTL
mmetsp:Transcript_906/g.2103  ORF Transcript_906/g.2103 Transcript_906/m.2103 type:complete len:105 (-) Transcript_906:9-323(-)